jgi:hypothetical protein
LLWRATEAAYKMIHNHIDNLPIRPEERPIRQKTQRGGLPADESGPPRRWRHGAAWCRRRGARLHRADILYAAVLVSCHLCRAIRNMLLY